MKNFLGILILSTSVILLNACAKPTVVDVAMPQDDKLNCEELENAVAEAQHFKRKAEYAKEGTGGNATRLLLFWPAWAKTLHNADIAIVAADDRTYHLIKIMKKKRCKGVDIINAEIANPNSTNSISMQLKDLKELYDSGDLTEDEFKKAKKKVLE